MPLGKGGEGWMCAELVASSYAGLDTSPLELDEDQVPQRLRFLDLVQTHSVGCCGVSLARAVVQRGFWPVVLIIQGTAWLTIEAGADAPQDE